MHEHPLINFYQRTRDGQALKISEFLTRSQFHRLGLYNEFYRPLSVEHQMAFTLPARPPLVIGIALNRGRPDFSERDRLILNLVRPHLIQAYRNAEIVTQMQQELVVVRQVLDKLELGVIVLTEDGKVRLATAAAQQLLEDYFGKRALRANRLPETLQRWARHQEALLATEDDVPPPRKPLVVEAEGRRLIVRHLCDREQCLLLLEEQLTSIQAAWLESLGLSRREAEVLTWLAYGKTNAEIGIILGISGQTVKKHLDNIYLKLGVENRTAAAARAYEIASMTTFPAIDFPLGSP